jgi:hypothetical protein
MSNFPSKSNSIRSACVRSLSISHRANWMAIGSDGRSS